MKTIYSILLLLVCSSFAGSINYPVARLYAYKQKISSGVNSTFDKKDKPVNREYVYLAVKQNRTIHVNHVWIDGVAVNFNTEEIKSPVAIDAGVSLSGKPTTEILVPVTTHTVLQLLIDYSDAANVKAMPKQYKNYALLMQYTEGNSVFFLGTQKWTTIAPKTNQ